MNTKMRYLPELAMVVLVIVLAHAMAKLTWLLIETPGPVKAEAISSTARVSTRPASQQAGHEIAAWDLFGTLTSDSTPATNLPVQAPDTSLQLTLEGVYMASEAKNSSAIISENGAAKRYHIGEEIQQGVSLYEVQSSHVILKRQSRFETLRFADPELQQVPINQSAPRREAPVAKVQVNKGIVNGIRSGQIRSVQDVLDNYGEHPAEQFQHFLLESGLQSTYEGGEPGLKISANTSSDILKAVGLMPGDILRSVNDYAITELQSNDTLMREILTSGRAKIVIQRGPRRFAISYPLPQR
ncbi:MAG TPA: type II secretion system protein N [Pseudomonadales bacterium]|nr:type II secretion system protein N [Pseudomonadales bacterium]